ncbi:MAG: hypothetical protein GWP03_05020 [Proteobacteria bacterium]|nr:hypothetical protein [Pseudomonadota bacterium]
MFIALQGSLRGEYFNTILLEKGSGYNSDINFKILSKYYGLKNKIIDLDSTQLVDSIFKNNNGDYIKSICISYKNLEDTSLISNGELNIIKNVISKGSNLIINDIKDSISLDNIEILTDSAFDGAIYFHNDDAWKFDSDEFNIADVLANTIVSVDSSFSNAYFINCGNCTSIISDRNDNESIFAYYKINQGKIFLNGNIIDKNLYERQLWKMYYGYSYLYVYIQNILPIMMFLKYSNGDMCWHSIQKYANLTIDDPYFTEPYGYLNFHDLLNEMQEHNFHTTIAFKPVNYNRNFDSSVVSLFKNYPNRFSIVQHGNNHDGYEFICYTQEQLDTLNEMYDSVFINQTPRPYKDQECDIVEGRTRLDYMYNKIGIDYGKEMVFPWGISLSQTLEMLKKYNFNATVNGQYEPYLLLPGDCDTNYDFNMRLANMRFRNFAVVFRRHPYSPPEDTSNPIYFRFKLNLFLDKPLLTYSHNGLFSNGQDAYSKIADSINVWYPDIKWNSLGYIMKRLYLEKLNFDSTIDVLYFGNDLVIENKTNRENLYHLKKYETGNVPINYITINGQSVGYSLMNDTLLVNVDIPAHSEREIKIRYYSGDKDFLIDGNYVKLERVNDTLYFDFLVSNMGADSGACPVCVYYNKGDTDSLLYLSAVYLNSYCSKMIKFPISDSLDLTDNGLEIKLDQFNLIDETNENNNDYIFPQSRVVQKHKIIEFNIRILKSDGSNAVFKMNSPLQSNCALVVFDVTGRRIFDHDYSINSGSNLLKFNYSKFHKGIYFADFKVGSYYYKTLKLVKY